VNDHIGRADNREVFVRRYTEIGVAVECERIQRPVTANLGPDLDLRRKPVLPADAGLDVTGLGTGASAPETAPDSGASISSPRSLLDFVLYCPQSFSRDHR
jgi:hypothetical protein